MDKKKILGENLRQLRREKSARLKRNLSTAEVAGAIGVSPACYVNWEAGRGSVSAFNAWRLADYYEVSIGDLVGRVAYEPTQASNQ